MLLTNNTNGNYTMRQLKLPLEIEKLIDISDPVYTFVRLWITLTYQDIL